MEKTSCEAAIGDFFEGGVGTGTSVFVKWSYWKLLLSTLTYSKAPGSGCSEVRKQKGRVFEYRLLFFSCLFLFYLTLPLYQWCVVNQVPRGGSTLLIFHTEMFAWLCSWR